MTQFGIAGVGMGKIDIITGTLGKALGGASSGFTSRRIEIIDMLRQRSLPYLFSNTLAPAITGASIAVLDLLQTSSELRDQLASHTTYFRKKMTEAGFDIKPGIHPIVPVMLYKAKLDYLSGIPYYLILESVKKMGFNRTGRDAIVRVLNNSVYAGIIRVAADDKHPEKFVQGVHEPIVSEEQFWRAQDMLGNNKRIQTVPQRLPIMRVPDMWLWWHNDCRV